MRRTLLLMATTALALLVACGVALAASINCPTASGGYCYGTNAGDALYGTSSVDRIYGYGGTDLMYGYGSGDFMYGGSETGLGDKMRGGGGADLVNGQGGNDVIEGGPGSDTLKTGTGSDRVEAQDGVKDFITCRGSNDLVYYDRGLDVLEGCPQALVELPPTESTFEPGTKVLVDHKGKELCLPEKALKGHLKHGDEILSWSGCSAQGMAQGITIIYCAEQDPQTPQCDGTDQTESLVGQDTRDVIRAFAGDDIINAERGRDDAFGGPGVDNINGKQGNDELSGGRGQDTVSDGVMENGQLSTGDIDVLRGNRGNDIFDARDNDFLDTINCGPGQRDTAFFNVDRKTDQSDAVADNCEFLNEIPGS